jgi:phospholipase/carboxylesterase
MSGDPHRDGAVLRFGAELEDAVGAVILLHGRGAPAEDILSLAAEFDLPQLAYLAPQAAGNSWYPHSFLAPVESNQPWLSSALSKVERVLQMAQDAGIAAERVVVGGFSQGACLASEFVASHPRRYAGLIALTGGLIGPIGADLAHAGDLAGTPAFFGSGDPDPHVPWPRVQESAEILTQMGAIVTARRYPGRGHTIGRDEVLFAKGMLLDAFFSGGELSKEGAR